MAMASAATLGASAVTTTVSLTTCGTGVAAGAVVAAGPQADRMRIMMVRTANTENRRIELLLHFFCSCWMSRDAYRSQRTCSNRCHCSGPALTECYAALNEV